MLLMRRGLLRHDQVDDFASRVGITEAVAAKRLRDLVDAGLFVREPYREPGQRTRYEYVLTESGYDLLPAVFALGQWGRKHLPHRGSPSATHLGCDAPVKVELRCSAGHLVDAEALVVTG